MTSATELGSTINERRLSLHYSIGQLANVVGVTASQVRSWENGEAVPDAANIRKLSDALGIKKTQLEKLVPKVTPPAKKKSVPDATSVVAAAAVPKAKPKAAKDPDPEAADADASKTKGDDGDQAKSSPDEAAERPKVKAQRSAVAAPAAAAARTEEPETVSAVDKAELVDMPTERIPVIKDAPPPPERQPAPAAVAVAAPPPQPRPASNASPSPTIVTPWRQTLETIFDRDKPWLFWIRTALLVVGLLILLRILAWAVPEFFTALGDILDTVQSTNPDPELQDPIPVAP